MYWMVWCESFGAYLHASRDICLTALTEETDRRLNDFLGNLLRICPDLLCPLHWNVFEWHTMMRANNPIYAMITEETLDGDQFVVLDDEGVIELEQQFGVIY
jgi:hypothetical protein